MKEISITENLIITDSEVVLDRIYSISRIYPDMEELVNHIANNKNCQYYLNDSLSIEKETSDTVSKVWLDTGIKKNEEPIVISLVKANHSDYFSGYYVGTPSFLTQGMLKNDLKSKAKLEKNLLAFFDEYNHRNPDSPVNKESLMPQNQNSSSLTLSQEIFKTLLFPQWRNIQGLERFVKIIGKRLAQLISQKKSEYYVINKFKNVIVNTGMMNNFGEDIFILYRFYENSHSYIAETLIKSKQDFLNNNFSKDQADSKISPITFFNDDERLFHPSYEDFDIRSQDLIHIIQDRRSRFPESIQNFSDEVIADRLLTTLKRNLRMQQRDHSFAKATYCGSSGELSWIIPFHIENKLTDSPELVIAIRKAENFYEIKTILPYDDELQDRLRALSLYSKFW